MFITFINAFSVMEKNHHDRNPHIYKQQEIKSYNLRPETHHINLRVNNNDNNDNNNNNYAPVCKEACKLTNSSMLSRDKRTKDSKGELINYLSGSDCIGLAYEAVNELMNL